MPRFHCYIGIDYSGAETANARLKGLSVWRSTPDTPPVQIRPVHAPDKNWTRQELAEWLIHTLGEGPPTLVAIDHAFSFPLRYFEVHHLSPDWDVFLDDFQRHWPTDAPNLYVDFVRDGVAGDGAARQGSPRWRRLTEERCRAKSVFHFDVPGSVAKSTHAGLPWLRQIRRALGPKLHAWPFDGWTPPPGVSVIAEAYPSLWNRSFDREGRNDHQHDAYTLARWMRETDLGPGLDPYFQPALGSSQQTVARTEGWILGLQ